MMKALINSFDYTGSINCLFMILYHCNTGNYFNHHTVLIFHAPTGWPAPSLLLPCHKVRHTVRADCLAASPADQSEESKKFLQPMSGQQTHNKGQLIVCVAARQSQSMLTVHSVNIDTTHTVLMSDSSMLSIHSHQSDPIKMTPTTPDLAMAMDLILVTVSVT